MRHGLADVTVPSTPPSTAVQLHLSDPAYTERLAAFLESLSQAPVVDAPGRLELGEDLAEAELAIYLRVWHVLYPEAVVTVERTSRA
jgi:hypothetical protein